VTPGFFSSPVLLGAFAFLLGIGAIAAALRRRRGKDRYPETYAATGGIAAAQNEEIADLRQRETAVLSLLDEMNAPRGILVIQAIAALGPVGRFDQSFALVIAERIRARVRQRRKLADRQHS